MSPAPPSITWSRLGLGTGTLASLGRASSAKDVERLLASMEEIGVTVIDTANTYGSTACERLLGRVLHKMEGTFTLVTKAGYCHGDLPFPLLPLNPFLKKAMQRMGKRQCFEPAYISKCLERSLSRLRVERVAAYMLHDASMEAVSNDRLLGVMEALKKSGKTQLAGVSSGEPAVLQKAISSGVFGVIQTPASLRHAKALRGVWQQCESAGIHVIANHIYDPLCFQQSDMSHESLMRASAALLPEGVTILCGTRNPAHLRQSNEWASNPMPRNDAERLTDAMMAMEK
jgi:pyridoxine 4-dehydrogenase